MPNGLLSVARALPRLGTPRITREDRPDGSFVLRSREPLGPYDARIGDWLLRWAQRTPERMFMAERVGAGAARRWRSVSYGEALEEVRRLAQGLLAHCRTGDGPVVAVSDNSLNLGLLGLAALYVGRPLAVVSSSYVRMTRDHARIHAILQRLDPALVYAEDGEIYGPALAGSGCAAPQVYARGVPVGGLAFDTLRERAPGDAVEAAHARVEPDTVAKLLLTSGSTGSPKVVVNTHRMLCANQQMIAQCWPFLGEAPPVVLDWLPWSHTFGANHNFNLVLRNGGSLYIDDGRPTPELVERTVQNLRDVRPTLYFNVPRGFDVLLPHLEADAGTARALFARLDALFYAAAALPASAWRRLEACASPHRDRPLFFTTAWGATETAPLITSAHFPLAEPGNVGVPAPGLELKFVPARGKLELRVRGVSVFREYRDDPERTAAAFDEEGFYRLGDAGRPADPADPSAGVLFDGRVAEDFKLSSGTWVSVGQLRLQAVSALAPLAQDAVVAGHDRDEVGLLLFASPAMRALAGDTAGTATGEALSGHPAVREAVCARLAPLYAGAGSSQRAARILILAEPPSIDAGEITDKGYVNQQAVLEQRAAEVQRLYSDDASVIRLA
ncbi:feruloyl-CoA synthase [Verticiella sediminum]|uniref:Feruloyl-CoA synthase n=2 Tax=Verticiella sediminum TaxID=1247510 RepID=A0A556AKN3_9BURK|nr:feruloyl-CoA synthase [Verticiella sediminum]